MKKKDFVQIKGSDLKELRNKVKDIKGEIANLTLDKNMNKLKDLKMISKKKKDIAQILTVIRQKEELSVLSSQLSENSQPVVSSSDEEAETEKRKTGKPKSENRKQKTDNRKKGTKK